jgi:hypothetical protein
MTMLNSNKLAVALVALLVLFAAGTAYLAYERNQLMQNPNAASEQKIREVVAKAEKLISLPEGELPTIIEVTNPDDLKAQPFFANAKAGNQVLLYANAQKAFLYDPTDNIIVEVASLNIGNQ